jgi:hypothetical protein
MFKEFNLEFQFCEHIFENIHYIPVEKRLFKDVRIELLTLDALRVEFDDSKTPLGVVLHFRRITT